MHVIDRHPVAVVSVGIGIAASVGNLYRTYDPSISHSVFAVYMQQSYLPMRIGRAADAHRPRCRSASANKNDKEKRGNGCSAQGNRTLHFRASRSIVGDKKGPKIYHEEATDTRNGVSVDNMRYICPLRATTDTLTKKGETILLPSSAHLRCRCRARD